MKKNIILLLIVSIFTSCNFSANATYENQQKDKEDAESVAGLLYLYTFNKTYDSIPNLMSKEFFSVSKKSDLIEFLKKKEVLLGENNGLELIDWKTVEVKGSDSKTEYILVYKVNYVKQAVEEKISLIKEDGKVKINGYAVNYDGLK